MKNPHASPPVNVTVGYAADASGAGVAYASILPRSGGQAVVLRAGFTVQRYCGLQDREVGYAAISAVATALRGRGVRRVVFGVEDEALVNDLHERRKVPPALELPYVRLGCALNRFDERRVVFVKTPELTARARAEAALHTAA